MKHHVNYFSYSLESSGISDLKLTKKTAKLY